MIALRPLREDEFAAWDEEHRLGYASGLVQHLGMSQAAAEAKVARDVAGVLPDGIATRGVHIWAVEADGSVQMRKRL